MTGPVGLSLSLGPSPVGGATAPTIVGFAYPGELLIVDGGTGSVQWRRDGENITGETSLAYTVGINDIGKSIDVIRGEQESDPVTCWHPKDEPGVSVVLLGNNQVFNAVDPEVEATDGQTVRRWRDQSANAFAFDQSTGANQPLRQTTEVSGNDTVQFDGVDDILDGGPNSVIRNKQFGYMIVACADTNRTGGNDRHAVLQVSTNAIGGAAVWMAMFTRFNGNNFAVGSRRRFTDSVSSAESPSESGYHVLSGEARWSAGSLRLRVDGTQVSADDDISSGPSQNADSPTIRVGSSGVRPFPGHVAFALVAAPDSEWTATQRSRIERYAGLLIGKDIPLVTP